MYSCRRVTVFLCTYQVPSVPRFPVPIPPSFTSRLPPYRGPALPVALPPPSASHSRIPACPANTSHKTPHPLSPFRYPLVIRLPSCCLSSCHCLALISLDVAPVPSPSSRIPPQVSRTSMNQCLTMAPRHRRLRVFQNPSTARPSLTPMRRGNPRNILSLPSHRPAPHDNALAMPLGNAPWAKKIYSTAVRVVSAV
jgi:hypothetical protein